MIQHQLEQTYFLVITVSDLSQCLVITLIHPAIIKYVPNRISCPSPGEFLWIVPDNTSLNSWSLTHLSSVALCLFCICCFLNFTFDSFFMWLSLHCSPLSDLLLLSFSECETIARRVRSNRSHNKTHSGVCGNIWSELCHHMTSFQHLSSSSRQHTALILDLLACSLQVFVTNVCWVRFIHTYTHIWRGVDSMCFKDEEKKNRERSWKN